MNEAHKLMRSEVESEMGTHKIWRYLKFVADWSYPVMIAGMGLWTFFFAPSSVDTTIELSKRQLLGLCALLVAMNRMPNRKEKKP